MDFFGIGPMEILLILIVALLVFGPDKLPQISRDLGKTLRAFKKATTDLSAEVNKELEKAKEEINSDTKQIKQELDEISSFKKATTNLSAEVNKELEKAKEEINSDTKQIKQELDKVSNPASSEK